MIHPHFMNILIHAGAGLIAIVIGFVILALAKGTALHRKLGKVFCYFTLIVCCSAIVGLVAFRFMPTFAVLTVLVLYQLVGGWRSVITQGRGPSLFDAVWTFLALGFLVYLIPIVTTGVTAGVTAGGANTIAYSTFGAIIIVIIYDCVRFFFPTQWHLRIWRYEHSYKLLSALFGMISALVGNVVRLWQPWSQLVPSVIGIAVIAYFFFKLFKEDRNNEEHRATS